jgi:hypothetical protein
LSSAHLAGRRKKNRRQAIDAIRIACRNASGNASQR